MTDFTQIRSMLKKKAMAEPGDTVARRAYNNMLEMTENLTKLSDWSHQRPHILGSLEHQQARLAELRDEQAS